MSTLIASHLGGVFPRDFPEMLWWSKSQWSKSDFTSLLVRYKHLHVICLILHKLGESKVEISAPNMHGEGASITEPPQQVSYVFQRSNHLWSCLYTLLANVFGTQLLSLHRGCTLFMCQAVAEAG
jgi:hypothetical protein